MEKQEPPWDDLDPGIQAVVLNLWDLGFQTCDSGDGVHKKSLGYDPDAMFHFPHVVIRVEAGQLEQEGDRLIEWVLDQGFVEEEVQVEAHAIVVELSDEPVTRIGWTLMLSGHGLYNYRPGAFFNRPSEEW